MCANFVCFMLAAMIVSGLTSSLTQLNIMSSERSKQFSMLRKYLIQNRISQELALRVQRNARHAIAEQQRMMPEDRVEVLSLISRPLYVELHYELYSPVLELHPFFERLSTALPYVMRVVCDQATSTILASAGDIIFHAGEFPTTPMMYIICDGILIYIDVADKTTVLSQGQWVSEPNLWIRWMHRGMLQATGDCRIVALDAGVFQDVLTHFDSGPALSPRKYGMAFVSYMNEVGSSVSDLASGAEGKLVSKSQTANTISITNASWGKFLDKVPNPIVPVIRRNSVLLASGNPSSSSANPRGGHLAKVVEVMRGNVCATNSGPMYSGEVPAA